MSESPIAVVTGANSGIGRATALHLAQQGHMVYGTVRASSRLGTFREMAEAAQVDVRLIELDITDDESVRRGFDQILNDVGRIDALVNNAGVGGNGVAEETDADRYLAVMNVNLCGAIRCLKYVLPGMRARQTGIIVNVSSMVGRVAAIAQSPYVASKFALEGVSEGLAQEVAPFGIRVVIIEPGVTRTAIFAKSTLSSTASPYERAHRRMLQFYSTGIEHATEPTDVARVIHHAITTDTPQLRYVVGWGAEELTKGRHDISDEDWVAFGAIEDDAEYFDRFKSYFGIDVVKGRSRADAPGG